MNKEKLKEANRLNKLIEEHEQALNCFEFDTNYYARDEDPNLPIALESTNPILIIEHDDPFEGGREQQRIPMVLSDFLINLIKDSIKGNLEKLNARGAALGHQRAHRCRRHEPPRRDRAHVQQA